MHNLDVKVMCLHFLSSELLALLMKSIVGTVGAIDIPVVPFVLLGIFISCFNRVAGTCCSAYRDFNRHNI